MLPTLHLLLPSSPSTPLLPFYFPLSRHRLLSRPRHISCVELIMIMNRFNAHQRRPLPFPHFPSSLPSSSFLRQRSQLLLHQGKERLLSYCSLIQCLNRVSKRERD